MDDSAHYRRTGLGRSTAGPSQASGNVTVTTTPAPSARFSARDLAAMELRDQAHDVEAEPQVRLRGVAARAHRHHRFEQAQRMPFGQRRPVVGDGQHGAPVVAHEPDFDGATRRELDGVGHELVQHLRDEIRRAVDGDFARRAR